MKKIILSALILFLIIIVSSCEKTNTTSEKMSADTNTKNEITTTIEESTTNSKSEVENNLTTEEAIDLLRNTYYKQNINCSEIDNNIDLSSIGVDKDAFQVIKYPTISDEECDHIYNVSLYEINPENKDNSAALNSLLKSLIKIDGIKKIVFDKGDYYFSVPIVISTLSDLYIEGNDSRIIMTNWVTSLQIFDSTNVHLNNIIIDYDPSPTISGTVVGSNMPERTIVLEPFDEFDLTSEIYDNCQFTNGSYMEYEIDEYSGEYIARKEGNLTYNEHIVEKSYDETNNLITIKLDSIKEVQNGTLASLTFRMYEAPGIFTQNVTRMYFENTDIICCPGMAFYNESPRNIYFDHSDVRRDSNSKKLMTAAADGIHCKDATGDLHITSCILEASHDDSVNICSFFKTIVSVDGSTVVANGRAANDYPFVKGNNLDVYDPESYQYITTLKIKNISQTNLTYTIEVSGDTSLLKSGYLLANATRVPKVLIENNIFRNKRNRGILVQFRNSKIINNSFYNVAHGPILMCAIADIFAEAIAAKDIEISNNKFVNSSYDLGPYGDVWIISYGTKRTSVGTIQDITITNNFFYDTHYSSIMIQGLKDSTISNNIFYKINKSNRSSAFAVFIDYSENLNFVNNMFFEVDYEDRLFKITNTEEDSISIENNKYNNIK